MPSREDKPRKVAPTPEVENGKDSNAGLYICIGVIVVLVAIAAFFA